MDKMGMTKARSMGPVVAAVQRAGGSVPRLFRRAELPQQLVDHPNSLIPLRDQLKLVEFAAFEIGDPSLPARLSTEGGVKHLGAFGDHVCAAPRLEVAIARCNAKMSSMLQSETRLHLIRLGTEVMWTYSLADTAAIGRQKNEILALGYMVDLMRLFAKKSPITMRAQVPGAPLVDRPAIQDILSCEITRGGTAALIFPASYLELANPRAPVLHNHDGDRDLPGPSDIVALVERMILLGLLDRRPAERWVCRRLRTSSRSMQRALAAAQTSYGQILGRVLSGRAEELVRDGALSITQIGYELGYSDAAHFTRAFARWFGESPQSWRRRAAGQNFAVNARNS